MQQDKENYSKYVQKKAPKSPIVKNCLFAFVIGGAICVIGQFTMNFFKTIYAEKEIVSAANSITMVFLGAFLTGIGVVRKDEHYRENCRARVGTRVPITGFLQLRCTRRRSNTGRKASS